MSYSYFAEYYDILTQNAEYDKRADYFLRLFQKHGHETGVTLDLACGTGTLTLELSKRGVDIFGCDMSSDMLSVAQQKAFEDNISILFICQKMQNLHLPGKIDTCICTLDSINHLSGADDVQKTFHKVSRYLNENGLFVFDMNTVYKHQFVLGDNCYIYDTEKVFCAWQNNYSQKDHEVIITLDFFEKDGNIYHRSSEQFSEKTYTQDQIHDMAHKAGFAVEAVYDDMSFAPLKPNSQRAVCVLRKRRFLNE